jgi:hypothetical protein
MNSYDKTTVTGSIYSKRTTSGYMSSLDVLVITKTSACMYRIVLGLLCLMPHVRYLAYYTLEQPGQMKDEPSRLLASKLTEYCIVCSPRLQHTFPLYLSLSFFCSFLVFVIVCFRIFNSVTDRPPQSNGNSHFLF